MLVYVVSIELVISSAIQSQEVTYAEFTMPRNKGYAPMRARSTESPVNGAQQPGAGGDNNNGAAQQQQQPMMSNRQHSTSSFKIR